MSRRERQNQPASRFPRELVVDSGAASLRGGNGRLGRDTLSSRNVVLGTRAGYLRYP